MRRKEGRNVDGERIARENDVHNVRLLARLVAYVGAAEEAKTRLEVPIEERKEENFGSTRVLAESIEKRSASRAERRERGLVVTERKRRLLVRRRARIAAVALVGRRTIAFAYARLVSICGKSPAQIFETRRADCRLVEIVEKRAKLRFALLTILVHEHRRLRFVVARRHRCGRCA